MPHDDIYASDKKGSPRQYSVAHILPYFKYEHLPNKLKARSKLFHDLAIELADNTPEIPELTVALRKLLESKDAAVRAIL